MGVMETKIIQVKNDPQVINAANEAWGRWGWSVLNIQVTHTQNTREYQDWLQYGSNAVTVETTTINYATITYQRDKSIPGYNRILELEQEYNQVGERIWTQFAEKSKKLYDEEEKLPVVRKASGKSIVLMLICVYFIVASFGFMKDPSYVREVGMESLIIIIVGAAIVFAISLAHYIKGKSSANKALLKQKNEKQNEIREARAKLDIDYNRMVNAEKERILSEAAELLRNA